MKIIRRAKNDQIHVRDLFIGAAIYYFFFFPIYFFKVEKKKRRKKVADVSPRSFHCCPAGQ